MKINCLSCGHSFTLDETYDDYSGPVKCWICRAAIFLKTEEGRLKSLALAEIERPSAPPRQQGIEQP